MSLSPYPEPGWRRYSPSATIACTAILGRLTVIHTCYMCTYIKSLTLNAMGCMATQATGALTITRLSQLYSLSLSPVYILLVHSDHTIASPLGHLVVVPPHNAAR